MQNTADSTLRTLIIGAGAVGVYVGGSLALHGHQVVFLTTPSSAQQLQLKGLRLNLLGRKEYLPNPKVCISPQEALCLSKFDIGIFALKSYDTHTALENLQPFREKIPPLLCLQNGVENEEVLATALGHEKVIAGTVTSSISRSITGEVTLERLRGVGIAGDHPLSTHLCVSLNAAGLNATLYPHAAQMKWSKLLTNLLANATSAILDMTPAQIYAHPGLYRIEVAQLREALAVMKANKVSPVDLPDTPVHALVVAIRYLPEAFSRWLLHRAMGRGRGGKMPSLHIDLHSKRGRSEVTFLNGAVVRAGESTGVPTPINRHLTETLSGLVEGRIPIDTFLHNPERLLSQVLSQPGY
jgi:2-dehydropantoate 2-reductase